MSVNHMIQKFHVPIGIVLPILAIRTTILLFHQFNSNFICVLWNITALTFYTFLKSHFTFLHIIIVLIYITFAVKKFIAHLDSCNFSINLSLGWDAIRTSSLWYSECARSLTPFSFIPKIKSFTWNQFVFKRRAKL